MAVAPGGSFGGPIGPFLEHFRTFYHHSILLAASVDTLLMQLKSQDALIY